MSEAKFGDDTAPVKLFGELTTGSKVSEAKFGDDTSPVKLFRYDRFVGELVYRTVAARDDETE